MFSAGGSDDGGLTTASVDRRPVAELRGCAERVEGGRMLAERGATRSSARLLSLTQQTRGATGRPRTLIGPRPTRAACTPLRSRCCCLWTPASKSRSKCRATSAAGCAWRIRTAAAKVSTRSRCGRVDAMPPGTRLGANARGRTGHRLPAGGRTRSSTAPSTSTSPGHRPEADARSCWSGRTTIAGPNVACCSS